MPPLQERRNVRRCSFSQICSYNQNKISAEMSRVPMFPSSKCEVLNFVGIFCIISIFCRPVKEKRARRDASSRPRARAHTSAVLFTDVDIHHSVAVSSQLLSASAHSCHRTSAAAAHKHTRQLNNNNNAGNCTIVVKHKFLCKVQKQDLVSATARAAWEREASALGSQSSCSFRRWRCSADARLSRQAKLEKGA